MFSFLKRLETLGWCRPVNRRQAPRRSRFIPVLERLEDRCMPAGVVNMTFASGVLSLTATNDVAVYANNNQSITLQGQGTVGQFKVLANDGETITLNGAPYISGIALSGVSNIRVVMGLGDDTVTVQAADLTGNLSVNGGDGSNTLIIDASAGTHSIGSMTVTNGNGADTLTIKNGNTTIPGVLLVNNGLGGSTTNFNLLGTDQTAIGSVAITNGDGLNNLTAVGASFSTTGNLTIHNGIGNTLTKFSSSVTSLGGLLSITNAQGSDSFLTGNASGTDTFTSKGLTIANGNGGSNTKFDTGTVNINGNFVVTNLFGDDTFVVNATGKTNAFMVTGSATIGNGISNTSSTSFNANTQTSIGAALTISNAAGADTLTFGHGNASSVALHSVLVQNGSGDSTTNFDAVTVTVTGNLSINNGDGFDTFDANPGGNTQDFTVTGGVTLGNGAGGSDTRFTAKNQTTIGGTPNALGILVPLSLTNISGNDSLTFGDGATSTVSLHSVVVRNGSGDSATKFDAQTVTVTGSFFINSGDGFDTFDANLNGNTHDFTVTGTVTTGVGTGGSISNFNPVNLTVGSNTTITNADGYDQLTFGHGAASTVALHSVVLRNSSGNSTTSFDAQTVTVTGSLAVSNGDGSDSFDANSSGNTQDFTVTGPVTISNGAGSSGIHFTANNQTTIGGTLNIANVSGSTLYFGNGATSTVALHGVVVHNGGSGFVFFDAQTVTVTGNLSITNGVGLDLFDANHGGNTQNFTVTGAVTVNNGSGGSNLSFTVANLIVSGTTTITSTDGNDLITFGAGSGSVKLHNVVISQGTGDSNTAFNAPTVTVTGNISDTAGDGFDYFSTTLGSTDTFAITGSVNLNFGAGGSTAMLSANTSVNLGAAWTVTAMAGNDSVSTTRSSVTGTTTINLGNGNDLIDFEDSSFSGAVNLQTGAGNDDVEMDTFSSTGIHTSFNNTFSLNTGAGDDFVQVGIFNDTDDFAAFAKACTFNGSLGLDTLVYLTTGGRFNTFAVAPLVAGFEFLG